MRHKKKENDVFLIVCQKTSICDWENEVFPGVWVKPFQRLAEFEAEPQGLRFSLLGGRLCDV